MPSLVINNHEYNPKVILFDVDGTLVDDIHRYSSLGKARFKTCEELASKNAAKEWARLTGVNPSDWSIDVKGSISKAPRRDDLALAGGSLYLNGFSWNDARILAEKIYNMTDEWQSKNYNPKLFDGVDKKLREFNKAGFILGVATNGVTAITEELLIKLNLIELFRIVAGADLVKRGKPDPDIILYACNKLGYNTSDCVYVGDQPTDVEASNKAGVMLSLVLGDNVISTKYVTEYVKSINDVIILNKS